MRGENSALIALGLAAVVVGVTLGASFLVYGAPEVVEYPAVYRDVMFDHAVDSDYAYYYFENRVNPNNTFSQAAHRWIRLWDYIRNVTVEETITVDGTTYANLRVRFTPIKVMQTLLWCEVVTNYTRVRGQLSYLKLYVNLTEAYEGAMRGWWDNDVSAYLKRTSLYGDGKFIRENIYQDGDTYLRQLHAYNIWIFNKTLNVINYSQSVDVMGPWDFYEPQYVNFSVGLMGNIVDGNRQITFRVQFNISRWDIPWALPAPEVDVPDPVERGKEVQLNVTTAEDADEYYFFWGDGSWSGEPVHVWAEPGNYTVCVFYRQGKNLSYIRTVEVRVI